MKKLSALLLIALLSYGFAQDSRIDLANQSADSIKISKNRI